MQNAVDKVLLDEQTGFRSYARCIDKIATLRIIVEQSVEWQSSLYNTLFIFKGIRQRKKRFNVATTETEEFPVQFVHKASVTDSFEVK